MDKIYQNKLHKEGRIWMIGALLLFSSVPLIISLFTGVWPEPKYFIPGLIATAVIFGPVSIIETITFAPMLGTSGTYLAFVTGNLTTIKVPAALNAQDALELEKGSEEGDVIATIAIAASSIITILIIISGILLIIPLTPLLQAPTLKPAFHNIIPALFGALGIVYIIKRWQLAIIPLIFMALFFLFVPNSARLVGLMVPVGVVITLVAARKLYKIRND